MLLLHAQIERSPLPSPLAPTSQFRLLKFELVFVLMADVPSPLKVPYSECSVTLENATSLLSVRSAAPVFSGLGFPVACCRGRRAAAV